MDYEGEEREGAGGSVIPFSPSVQIAFILVSRLIRTLGTNTSQFVQFSTRVSTERTRM